MDANGTRFWMLLGEADWGDCTAPDGAALRTAWGKPELGDLDWDAERNELHLRAQVFRFTQGEQPVDPQLDRRRGAAQDRYGNWYWIDETSAAVRVWSAGSERASRFWPPPESPPPPVLDGAFGPVVPAPVTPAALCGLAVTTDHYLVVGTLDPGGLLVFDLHAGGPPRWLLWPAGLDFAPYDMAPTPGGGLVVLDRAARRYWAFDRNLRVIPTDERLHKLPVPADDFRPTDGGPSPAPVRPAFPAGFDLLMASPPLPGDPVAIEVLPDGGVLLLINLPAARFAAVAYYRGGHPVKTVSLDILKHEVENPNQFTLFGYDMALVYGRPGGKHRLVVAGADGNQAYAFEVTATAGDLSLKPEPSYLPMRLFGGRALVSAGGRVFYDIGERWVPLVAQSRPRYVPEATLLTRVFDGREPGCVWHRLMLDACLPPGTAVRIWSCASDECEPLAGYNGPQLWQEEPQPYLRGSGSEIPFVGRPTAEHQGTYELLLQQARGRYLQLKITLQSGAGVSPRLGALRVYYPRFSYLEHYLPAVYREEPLAASFLDRFLANIEGLLTGIEDRIAAANLLVDIRSAPPETLEWLARWFDVALDPAWDERQRRLFIAHAMTLFQWRGTARGIVMALRLAFEPCVGPAIFDPSAGPPPRYRIVEQFRTRRVAAVALGDPTAGGGLTAAAQGKPWAPADGAADLRRRYRAWLQERGLGQNLPPQTPFPLRDPGGNLSAVWQAFAQATLGFVPAAVVDDQALWQSYLAATYGGVAQVNQRYGTSYAALADVPAPQSPPPPGPQADDWLAFSENLAPGLATVGWLRWRDFLTRRYRRIKALNDAYGTDWPSFAAVPPPRFAPERAAALLDWYLFAGRLLPMHTAAHRFRVLLPNPQPPAGQRAGLQALQQEQLRLARRIVELEKPAHTEFSVSFYWAMFRLGEVRLGDDTLIAEGSRSALLAPPAVLNDVYLGETFLAPGHPLNIPDRLVVGRDRLPARGATPAPTESLFDLAPPPQRSHL